MTGETSSVGILYKYDSPGSELEKIEENVDRSSIEITKNAAFYQTYEENEYSNYYRYSRSKENDWMFPEDTGGTIFSELSADTVVIEERNSNKSYEENPKIRIYKDGIEMQSPVDENVSDTKYIPSEAAEVCGEIDGKIVYKFNKTNVDGDTRDLYIGKKKLASNVQRVQVADYKILYEKDDSFYFTEDYTKGFKKIDLHSKKYNLLDENSPETEIRHI